MINYDENSRAVYQKDRGNESMYLNALLPSPDRMLTYESQRDNTSIETRLLCIAAAFALVLTAVPPS